MGYVRYLEASRGPGHGGSGRSLDYLAPLEFRAGQGVLEVGCGTGKNLRAVAALIGTEGRIVGLDNSLTMLVEARGRVSDTRPPVELQLGDVHQMPFEDSTFDRCWCTSVFMHLAEPERALAEMIRVTCPGGKVAVRDVDWGAWIVDAADPELTRRVLGCIRSSVRNPASGRRLAGMMARAGLGDIEVHPVTKVLFGRWTPHQKEQMWAMARCAVRRGAVTRSEAAAWLRDLRERSAAGAFFEAKTLFCVVGKREPKSVRKCDNESSMERSEPEQLQLVAPESCHVEGPQ